MESEQVPDPRGVLFKLVPAFLESHPAAFTKNIIRVHTLAGQFPEGPNSREQNGPNVTFEAAQISASSRALSIPWKDWVMECYVPFFKLIYLFLAVLGLCFCARAFSICGKRGPLFIVVRGPLTIAASHCRAQAPDVQAQ